MSSSTPSPFTQSPHPSLADINISSQLDQLPASLRHYLQVLPPDWLTRDSLYKQILAMPMLYRNARVVWGALVQANSLMLQPREEHCPGDIVYDSTGNTQPGALLEMAHALYQLKNTTPTQADQLACARHLTGELGRLFAHPYPPSLYPQGPALAPMQLSSVWFWRPHLPNGMLSLQYFPILISDDPAFAGQVMVLPALFWPEPLTRQWLEHDISHEDYIQPATLAQLPKLEQAVPPLSYLFKGEYSSPQQIREFLNPLQIDKNHKPLQRLRWLVVAALVLFMLALFFY